MIENLKYRLISNWDFFRVLRLGLSALILIQAWINRDWLVGMAGGVILFQTLMNVGCCGSSACNTYQPRTGTSQTKESVEKTTFTEIE
ncbi:MAG: hypothetical protein ACLQQ4_11090 [Bacteroidia bacterium]